MGELKFIKLVERNKNYTFYGVTLTLKEWAKVMEVPVSRIQNRILKGKDIECSIFKSKGE